MATRIVEQQKLEELLRTPSAPPPERRRLVYAAAALILVAGLAGVWRMASGQKPGGFITAPVRRETINKTISATGSFRRACVKSISLPC